MLGERSHGRRADAACPTGDQRDLTLGPLVVSRRLPCTGYYYDRSHRESVTHVGETCHAWRRAAAMEVYLETEHLVLRRFTADDVDNLCALDADPDVMHFITGGRPTPREE